MSLRVKPCELKEANAFVASLHRHHKPVVGHRFSLKTVDADGVIHGVAICGRPVARMVSPTKVLEVTRLCTDGTYNSCSILYAAAARAAQAMGYEKIQTYLLESEPATSVKASGWEFESLSAGGEGWQSRPGRRSDQPIEPKQRWGRVLNAA
jgi:hypothetical protein